MLTIRNEQLDAMGDAVLATWLTSHVRKHFREETAGTTDIQLRALVQAGIGRARSYGIREERSICKFVDLLFLVGHDFDSRFAWARDVLRNPRLSSDRMRIDLLASRVRDYLDDQIAEPPEA
jgi:hypothetical protein